ncbi:hypothetical protein EV05_1957 [Prochlorococcus sp. MIT 0601]|nr:hypothetical protein EV05_1957 [Prochlorococcus sp. MIT 0601]
MIQRTQNGSRYEKIIVLKEFLSGAFKWQMLQRNKNRRNMLQ